MKLISSGRGIHTSKFHQKKVRQMRLRRASYLIFLLLVVGMLSYFAFSSRFHITQVVVVGDNVTSKREITLVAEDLLSGRYYGVWPRRNALIYPEGEIREILLRKFPKFDSVDISLEGSNTLVVEVVERGPVALYCTSSSTCYFVDGNGLIFDRSPDFSSGIYFVYRTSPAIPEPVGAQLIATEIFVSLSHFVESLEELGVSGTILEIRDGEFALILESGGEVMWSAESDPNLVRSNLELFLNSEEIKAEKDFLSRVSYIDLRTDNKVFYHFTR